jgi:hypothetical protein
MPAQTADSLLLNKKGLSQSQAVPNIAGNASRDLFYFVGSPANIIMRLSKMNGVNTKKNGNEIMTASPK